MYRLLYLDAMQVDTQPLPRCKLIMNVNDGQPTLHVRLYLIQ